MIAPMDFEILLKDSMGLDPASVGSSTIERAVRQRMNGTGIAEREDYWRELRGSKEELQALIEAVVVPETWFFRDPEAFAVLARLATEEWLPAHRGVPLRALSIPCSTGEEPWSIVIALLEGGLSRQQIHVDAVDISAQALARARYGEYGRNSFRGGDEGFIARYFQRTPAGYSLTQEIRDLATFRQGNILSLDPGFVREPYDVIFCRNLLIYFDRPTQERIMQILGSLLAPAGFLFVGGAETYLASRSGFTSVNRSMSFAFRKAAAKRDEPDALTPALRPISVKLIKAIKPPPFFQPIPVPSPVTPPVADLEITRRLADAGRLQEAAAACESHMRMHAPSSESWYLLGIIRDALGDGPRAIECYRKVLYSDPDHVDALTHLALLMDKQGDVTSAGRFRDRIRRIGLRARPERS